MLRNICNTSKYNTYKTHNTEIIFSYSLRNVYILNVCVCTYKTYSHVVVTTLKVNKTSNEIAKINKFLENAHSS